MYINKKEQNVPGVYRIECNNNVYIGSSVCIYTRLMEHRSHLRNNKHANKHLQNAFNKHGEFNFKINILCVCEKNISLLRSKELFYMKSEVCVFNKTTPVTYEMSNESKQKISSTLKEKYSTGILVPANIGKGIKVDVYNYAGELVFNNTTIPEISKILNYSNRSVIRQSILRGNHLFKNHIIFDKNVFTYHEWIKKIKGAIIPVYKVFNNGEIKLCSSSSKEKVISKILIADNFMYYSLKNKCYYTFLGNLIKCPYYKKL